MLDVYKVNAGYGDLQVVSEVSFEVNEGEIVALVGSNGAGKTTTLRTICGHLKPISGQIKLNGEEISRLPPNKIVEKGITLIPEGRRLFPFMTVLENLLVGAYGKQAREKKEDSKALVFQIFPKLEERKSQLASTLSGGEQQMLAIGRGLMSRPKLLMFDEPSIGLSPILVDKTFETIQTIRTQGVTVLLVEQNVRMALSVADRTYVLENGKIVIQGAKELFDNEYVKKAYLGL